MRLRQSFRLKPSKLAVAGRNLETVNRVAGSLGAFFGHSVRLSGLLMSLKDGTEAVHHATITVPQISHRTWSMVRDTWLRTATS